MTAPPAAWDPSYEDGDEFSLLAGNAAEVGLSFDPGAPPPVHRASVPVPSGGTVSALVWGDGPAELVLLHGGAQNAHTWDTTALALGRPLVALDLPGHGHSSWRPARDYAPAAMADDVAAAAQALAPHATTLVGMSLGGLTATAVLGARPDVADRLVLVDITPGVDARKAGAVITFVAGPAEFPTLDAIVERTVRHHPTRSRASLERGVRHNARPDAAGTWRWRYDRPAEGARPTSGSLERLWSTLGGLPQPVTLVRGGNSPVVDEADVARLRSLRPGATVLVVDGAGHSVQGDQPLALAALLAEVHGAPARERDRPGT
jgi:pimeloyl-ACP methyl ester carboxylesterase